MATIELVPLHRSLHETSLLVFIFLHPKKSTVRAQQIKLQQDIVHMDFPLYFSILLYTGPNGKIGTRATHVNI